MARPKKARAEGGVRESGFRTEMREQHADARKLADPVPGNDGAALARITAYFREKYPEEWARIHLSPTENGIDHMVTFLSR